MSTAGVDRRWWLGEGDESCGFCFHGYAIEVETRCFACDEPGCVHCFTTVTATAGPLLLCGSCAEEEAAPDRRVAQKGNGGR